MKTKTSARANTIMLNAIRKVMKAYKVEFENFDFERASKAIIKMHLDKEAFFSQFHGNKRGADFQKEIEALYGVSQLKDITEILFGRAFIKFCACNTPVAQTESLMGIMVTIDIFYFREVRFSIHWF